MNHEQRNAFIEKEFEKIMSICKTKGIEYSNSTEDANENFKKLSRELGMDPKQILWVYHQKHNQAISNFLKDGVSHSNESIEGRIHDAILYHFILLSLIAEEKENVKKEEQGEVECCHSCSEGGECEKSCEENPKPKRRRKFKIGDRVKIIQRYYESGREMNTTKHDYATITKISLEDNNRKLYWTDLLQAFCLEDGDKVKLVK